MSLDHWDGYLQTNNYRIYRDPESGRYFFLPHGADQTLNNPNGDIFREVRGVVAQAFFATDEGKNLFMDEMENILATVWHPATNRSRLKVRYETIRPHVLNDSLYGRSISDFDRDVAQTATFFGERQRMARWQLMAEFDPLLKRNIESLISGSGPFGNRNRGGGRRGGGFRGR